MAPFQASSRRTGSRWPLDLDLHVNRSMSLTAKVYLQARRDQARRAARDAAHAEREAAYAAREGAVTTLPRIGSAKWFGL